MSEPVTIRPIHVIMFGVAVAIVAAGQTALVVMALC